MRAWRIYPHDSAYARAPGFDPLDAAGGLHSANRWNERGLPVIYASESPSLAALETLAHLERPADFGERTLVGFECDGVVETVSAQQVIRLREDAPADDPELHTRAYGTTWLREHRSLILLVPSFVMPYELNVLVNPLHPQKNSLKLTLSERLRLDRRIAR